MLLKSHYLRVLLAGIFSLTATIGVARFAYTPMLPVMQAGSDLSIAAGGWLATSNYLGYFAGALIAASLTDLTLKDKLYRLALMLAVVTTVAMGLTESLWWWSLWRFIAGLASAGGLLIGSGLMLHWLVSHNMRAELGMHFLGMGGGIALVSLLADWMLGQYDWQQQWHLFGLLATILVIPAWLWLPKPNLTGYTNSGEKLSDRPPSRLFFNLLITAYFCAGVGFAIITTFMVAHINQLNPTQEAGNLTFLVLGLAAAPACIVWDLVTRHIGFLKAISLAFALQLLGSLLPVINHSPLFAYTGAILFGGTFIGIVSMVLTMAGRFYPTKPAKMMGKMTLSYGVAQILAPTLGGMLGEWSGNYHSSFYMASATMAVGLLLMLIIQWWVPVFADGNKADMGDF